MSLNPALVAAIEGAISSLDLDPGLAPPIIERLGKFELRPIEMCELCGAIEEALPDIPDREDRAGAIAAELWGNPDMQTFYESLPRDDNDLFDGPPSPGDGTITRINVEPENEE